MNRGSASRGSVLILALWSLAFLSFISVSTGYGVRQKATLLDRLDSWGALYGIAYAGVEKARGLFQIEDVSANLETLGEEWAHSEDLFDEIPVGDGFFSVGYTVYDSENDAEVPWFGLIDEERFVNINTADATTLMRLFGQIGGLEDQDEAEDLAYAVIDWRDADSAFQHPAYGAEDDYYDELDAPYESKDAAFDAPEELLLVKGMSREIFDKIQNYISIFGSGLVNINTASGEVLKALGMEAALVEKILAFRAGSDGLVRTPDDRFFSQGAAIVSELRQFLNVDFAEESVLNNLVATEKMGTSSTFYRVRSKAVLAKNGASLLMEAVIDRKGKIYYTRFGKVQWPPRV